MNKKNLLIYNRAANEGEWQKQKKTKRRHLEKVKRIKQYNWLSASRLSMYYPKTCCIATAWDFHVDAHVMYELTYFWGMADLGWQELGYRPSKAYQVFLQLRGINIYPKFVSLLLKKLSILSFSYSIVGPNLGD